MASLQILTCILLTLISTVHSQTCKSQSFKTNNNTHYTNCIDLPTLSSYLHFTYNSSNSTLSIAFISTPPKNGGWVSWALNPTSPKMSGARALVAYTDSKGSLALRFYNITGYTGDSVVEVEKLDFEMWETRAEQVSGGSVGIFGKVKVPTSWVSGRSVVYHVWQVGPSVSSGGVLAAHDMGGPNFQATGALDLSGGGAVTTATSGDSRTTKRNVHGVLNVVSWGILFPVGVIVARYMRVFKSADPAWFYMHVSCQVSAYAIGVAGWATGLKLGSDSKGIQYSSHRNIGIALFALATLQIFALFLRPKKDHKYRIYWNVYHHGVGYAIVVLGILNVFKGLGILHPLRKYRTAYTIVIVALGGVALLLEIITWIIVLKRKSKSRSTKPYA